MKNLLFLVLLSAGTICSSGLSAQLTAYHQDPDASFKQAKDLYQKELFSLAYPIFQQLNTEDHLQSPMPANIARECRYYYLVCGLQLNDSSIVNGAESFIALETDPARVQMLNFQLGEYFFRQRNYAKAQACYQSVGIANLNNREIAEMKFHQAYGYFVMQQFREAKPLFNAIRQLPDDPNYLDANYYYGFICFSEKQYPSALDAFRIARRLPAYQSVIPFYLAEIFYFTGNRDSALYYGEDALKKPAQFYTLQLQQLVGHIWFEKQAFEKAQPYLEAYVAGNAKVRREDLYELSFCYYHAAEWDKCIEGFKQLSGAQDSLSQNSMYLLADAYLKVHDKANARTAFQFCASSNSNPKQKEVSAFNYAKLSYDLGYMDAALKAFKAFVADYPRSEYLQEARELLVNTLANTSNYKEALQLYDALPQRSDYAVHLYPRLLYGASVEYINDQQLDRADALLTRLLSVPYNELQLPLAYFWKGEIAYRNGQNDASIGFFLNYLKRPVTNGEVNITNARYSLAYAYLRTEDYTLARDYFEMVTKTVFPDASAIIQDAYLRTADCYYMAKDFTHALHMYEQVIQLRLPSADYALYQKAIIAGAQNRNDEKIRLLSTLDKQYPGSAYLPDASLEIANTYLADENFEAALAPLHQLMTNPHAGVLLPKAYLKSGIANFNLNKNDAALKDFTKLVTSYPNTTECNAAIEYIRNIFVESQQPGAFADFMKQNG
ncbi:MAG TPA: tetratricopeptide repeat protein, partial [Sediminibacterium sp.]|nr:tetratricopeptide repeat protein [Sediminibacterium sp.]